MAFNIKNFLSSIFQNIDMIIINRKQYQGKSVTVINNRVFIDGKDMTPDAKQISIEVTADINQLSVDYCDKINVVGNVKNLNSISGDVNITGDVSGDVTTTSGDIDCKNISGNVQTVSGDVESEKIEGNVKTVSGDIN